MTDAESSPPLEITVRLGFLDFYLAMLRVIAKPPLGCIMVLPLGMFLVSVWSAIAGSGSFLNPAIFVLFVLVFPGLLLLWQLRSGIMKHVTYRFSETGIVTEHGAGNNFVQWGWVKRAVETRRYVQIFIKQPFSFLLVPTNQLTEADAASVRAILREHLQDGARLRS